MSIRSDKICIDFTDIVNRLYDGQGEKEPISSLYHLASHASTKASPKPSRRYPPAMVVSYSLPVQVIRRMKTRPSQPGTRRSSPSTQPTVTAPLSSPTRDGRVTETISSVPSVMVFLLISTASLRKSIAACVSRGHRLRRLWLLAWPPSCWHTPPSSPSSSLHRPVMRHCGCCGGPTTHGA